MKAQAVYLDKTKSKLFTDNLVAGIGWGMGTVLGALVLVTFLGMIASKVQTIPIIGEFVYGIIVEVGKLQGK
ncbi:hypothetical protein COZ14_04750 [Candidatus Dojkabacteria bacterium CG_4_10_14_3_um_filter_Dojkabacteria_WS6_41_9]|uniref:Uncharacterized protein n=1 Tax=Candidatus Dojkabacteria bacterium CG_4_10_14_0_2_um_filter_Dojkabacteria_WS6_41_15 TaxID=2014249 RepID=A0A2M7W210_9BACT|nr:MAG: hypothetical protein COZ14_04750 [Candidatus Dojkabacteria bacterium CG_4_10_14_3_um_filter_Dojkabacteria_WS6_41_9]PJA14127.1 MAG: hypothetical protein COX64_02425 [Candidatus Dojkabacteria bacterium CG_4_10_14_0_2_um_filter_Dojkabacteria_WS6_41_15]